MSPIQFGLFLFTWRRTLSQPPKRRETSQSGSAMDNILSEYFHNSGKNCQIYQMEYKILLPHHKKNMYTEVILLYNVQYL
jgi:hypothetical protein